MAQQSNFEEWLNNQTISGVVQQQNKAQQYLERVTATPVCLTVLPVFLHLLCFPPEHPVVIIDVNTKICSTYINQTYELNGAR